MCLCVPVHRIIGSINKYYNRVNLPWSGPYSIHSVTSRGTYKLIKFNSNAPLKNAVPRNQLKPYIHSEECNTENIDAPTTANLLMTKNSSPQVTPDPHYSDLRTDDESNGSGDVIMSSSDILPLDDKLKFNPVDAEWQTRIASLFYSRRPA